jgi:hypothetical protein
MLRNVTESQKRRVAGRQRFSCAASVQDYQCPLKGEPFDESGYEIDHIKELRDGGTNDLSNLQALCIMCHRVKTNRTTTAMSKKETATHANYAGGHEHLGAVERDVQRVTGDAAHAARSSIRCHHCHETEESARWAGPIISIEGRYFCQVHNPGSCKYLGCLGKDEVHAVRIGPLPGDLDQFRYVPRNRVLGRR